MVTPQEEQAIKQQVWKEASDWGYTCAFNDLLHKTDKAEILLVLFRKASEMKDKEPERAKEWEAYSEGFRHALNIVENLDGNSLSVYKDIINPSLHMEVTEEDIKRLR